MLPDSGVARTRLTVVAVGIVAAVVAAAVAVGIDCISVLAPGLGSVERTVECAGTAAGTEPGRSRAESVPCLQSEGYHTQRRVMEKRGSVYSSCPRLLIGFSYPTLTPEASDVDS